MHPARGRPVFKQALNPGAIAWLAEQQVECDLHGVVAQADAPGTFMTGGSSLSTTSLAGCTVVDAGDNSGNRRLSALS